MNSYNISTTLATDFITFLEPISSNTKGGQSHLDHTIIFEDFIPYSIYDILEILWLGFVSHNQNMVIHPQDVLRLRCPLTLKSR